MTMTFVMIMTMVLTLTICKVLILVTVMMANVVFVKLAIGLVVGLFWLNLRNGLVEPFNSNYQNFP